MEEITRENYREFYDFSGIIVAVPKFSNKYFFLYGYGYEYREPECLKDTCYSLICYASGEFDKEGVLDVSNLKEEYLFSDFDVLSYYHFKNFEEFCVWYLEQKGKEVYNGYGKEDRVEVEPKKEWIHEKCGTNTPPTNTPEHPNKNITYKTTRREQLKDVIKLIQYHQKLEGILRAIDEYPTPSLFDEEEEVRHELNKWLNEEVKIKE